MQGESSASGSRVPSHRRCLGFGDTLVAVESADRGTLDWLEEFCCPPFRACGSAAAQFLVHFATDAARHAELAAVVARGAGETAPCFALDTRVVRHRAHREDGRLVLFDSDYGCCYTVALDRIEVVAHPDSEGRRGALMRVLRELAAQRFRRRTRSLELHAAALAVDGRGLFIAGPKNAGKTTLLLHALRSADARLISNDRVFVEPGKPSVIRGVPTIVSIRPETLAMLPELGSGIPQMRHVSHRSVAELAGDRDTFPGHRVGERLRLSPAQLCRQLAVGAAASAPLPAGIFCAVDRRAAGFGIEPLDAPGARVELLACRYGIGSGDDRRTVFGDLMGVPAPWDEEGLAGELAGELACFRVRVGSDAYAAARGMQELLDRVLA